MADPKHTHEEIINLVRNIPAEKLPELYDLLQGFLQGQKRDYARKQLSGEVDLVIQDRVYKQQMENISASGVFVRMKGKFETGAKVRFVLNLPETKNTLKLTGHITRVADDGIAIRFDNTTPYFQSFLNEQIWKE
jgi:transcriptional regulator of heat shock response